MQYTLDKAVDIGLGTLADIRRKNPPLATFAYPSYQFYNAFWRNNVKTVGDEMEGFLTLKSEDNASHKSWWDEDALSKKNIQQKYKVGWAYAQGGMLWSMVEKKINSGKAKLYDAWQAQYNSAVKDMIEEIFNKILTGRTSATDDVNPMSVFQWIPWGTNGSTGGYTGYDGHYNDGGGASANTFNRGGLSCSAAVNPDFASWFADHDGNIDDSLFEIMDKADLVQNFQPPLFPEKLPMERVSFARYTTQNVINKLKAYLRKSDDMFGYRASAYMGTPSPNGIPMVYCPPLDTANTSVYGTDPILGLNHNNIYPVILEDFDFAITKGTNSKRHLVGELFVDLVYQVWCENPKYSGYLISNCPS